MDMSLVGQYWLVALMLTLTPGADWAFAIGAGLRARSIAPSILGVLFGYAVWIAVVAFGVGSLVTRYPATLTVLTIAGASYLLWLGVSTLVRPFRQGAVSDEPVGANTLSQFLRGTGVSGTNPKGLLLLLALLPQFISAQGWPSSAQMLVLGAIHLLNCAAVYSTVAFLARRILRSRPRASLVVTKASGIVMTLVGVALLVERVVGGL
jgi:threonine/homoserine/homoserine lactone efflux protein